MKIGDRTFVDLNIMKCYLKDELEKIGKSIEIDNEELMHKERIFKALEKLNNLIINRVLDEVESLEE